MTTNALDMCPRCGGGMENSRDLLTDEMGLCCDNVRCGYRAEAVPSEETDTFETTADGFIVNTDTGEVVGHVEAKVTFEVVDEASATWVLAKISDADAQIAGLTVQREAIVANLDAMIKRHQDKKSFLLGRFSVGLEAVTRRMIAGRKERFFQTAFGRCSLRQVKGGAIKVMDEPLAIEWAREHCPSAVKVVPESYSILKTPLGDVKAILPPALFEISVDRDEFTVSTGVEKGGRNGRN